MVGLKEFNWDLKRLIKKVAVQLSSYFRGKPYSSAGKTGTAEAFYDGPLEAI